MQNVDVAIVGSGIIGLALACGLKDSGLRTVVLKSASDKFLTSDLATSEIRVSSINIASEKLLNHLDIWKKIDFSYVGCYNSIEVWEKDSFGYITFDGISIGYSHLGHIVKNAEIRRTMLKQIKQHDNITLISHSQIKEVIWRKHDVCITLQSGDQLTARLLVGADGANSWIRKKANIPVSFLEYRHCAIVATVRTTEPHGNVARQVFHHDNILAFLPLNDPYLSSIVWSLESSKARKILEFTPKTFNKILCVAFDNRLGPCTVKSKRQVICPLIGSYARQFTNHRLVLIGDAAHTVHPLAGQGANLGFMDVAFLIEELCKLCHVNEDIGHPLHLKRYERNRKYSTAMMIAAIHGIYDLFSKSNPTKKLMRGIGLRIVDNLTEIKLCFLRQAIGINDLPEWLY